MATRNPLTDADRQRIDDMMEELEAAEDLIRRAEIADIDVSAEKVQAREQREKLARVRQGFFPPGS